MGVERETGIADRALAALLLLLMVIGAFVLWVGVPAGVLWTLGKLISNRTEHLILGLLAVPSAMVVFGLLLAGLNAAYLRVVGASSPESGEEDEWRPRLRGPLDRIVAVSAIIALLAFLGWMLFGDMGTGSVPPW
jgi:hypothetical protein